MKLKATTKTTPSKRERHSDYRSTKATRLPTPLEMQPRELENAKRRLSRDESKTEDKTVPKIETSVELKIKGRLERIPDGDGSNPEFLKWCRERGVTAFVNERRGWYGAISRSIHDAQYIFWVDNTDEFMMLMQAEVDEMFVEEKSR